ncbi:MAG: hypothetical protein RLZZ164_1164 [Actinomycetota bacterium]
MIDFAAILADLDARGLKLAIAESLTGGLLSATVVDVPGASKVLLGSIVAYQNSLKQNLLNISASELDRFHAVSAETAVAMAQGAIETISSAAGIDPSIVVGLATTGVAGPDADGVHPVGQVFIAVVWPGREPEIRELHLAGSRGEIRSATVLATHELLGSLLA